MCALMSRRIRRILLVCNNYDKFALEEDGRLEEQIAQEYLELNLSNPPSIHRVETSAEAVALVEQGKRFDMVMAVYNTAGEDIYGFADRMKKEMPDAPFVLLSNFNKTLHLSTSHAIDYRFCWNSQTDLIIAIIKLLEDKLNAESDILENGVQGILLVEDSVRYYSTYLPVLYKLILTQNQMATRDTLNEQQLLLRKRSRPKILMATCMDEAERLYNRYKNNLLGVISDIGFVRHRGDSPETELSDAGLLLTRMIREDNPKMPIVLQSSQQELESEAQSLGVGFILKKSKTLTQQLSDYIGREFGFGDFVVTDRQGRITHRARDLREFEHLLAGLSREEFYRLTTNNYLSKWLFARGLFEIGRSVREHHTTETNVEESRDQLVAMIRNYRIASGRGVVARYRKDTYNDTIRFCRLGESGLGGKARGLAFLNHLGMNLPRTMVITTEYFDRFIVDNGLQEVINADLSDEDLLQEFVTSGLPDDMIEAIRQFVRRANGPIAVRSSSKLEDSYYQPFAGVYATYMIPRTEHEDQTMRLLKKAIKSVYASVYMQASRGYIISSGNLVSDEKMAVVLQEVVGHESADGRYFYPTISGVARSINFYPVGNERAEDGIVKIAYGLGKSVVDGNRVLRFNPKYPRSVMQTSTIDHVMTETQRTMYALSLEPERFRTSVDDAVNLVELPIEDCEGFADLRQVASTFDMQNMRMVDNCVAQGPRYITMAMPLKYDTYPLADEICQLLDMASREMKCPVEIEFAVDLTTDDPQLQVLQIRPISADSLKAQVNWDEIDETGSFLRSENALGIGKTEEVYDIVYLRPEAWDKMRTTEMAATLREWNDRFRKEGRGYLLIGFGRWGSSIPSLGVPVKWADISEARAIVEASREDFRVDPSQGSHFFQNLTSFNVGYINIDTWARPDEVMDFSALDALPAVAETELVRHVCVEKALEMVIDGFESKAIVKMENGELKMEN